MIRKNAAGLNPRQDRFVREYLKDLNGKQAAIRAGYSPRTAESQASDLLRVPKVRGEVDRLKAARANKLELTADRILLEVARIALFDPRKLVNDDGTARDITKLDDDTAAAIQGIEITEEYEWRAHKRNKTGTTKKYRIADKNAALSNALRHLGLLTEKIDITSKGQGLAPDYSRLSEEEQLELHGLLRKAKAPNP